LSPADLVGEGKLAYIIKEGRYFKNIIFQFIQFDHVNDDLALCTHFFHAPCLRKALRVSETRSGIPKAQVEIYTKIKKLTGL